MDRRGGAAALQALAAAALALPGLGASGVGHAASDGVDFQYSHYSEGERDVLGRSGAGNRQGGVIGLDSKFDPIEVDSLHLRGRSTLSDRLSASVDFQQDTWAGASPVGTAPAVVAGNRLYRDRDPVDGVHLGSGASPLLYDTQPFFLKRNGDILRARIDPADGSATPAGRDNRLTHVLSSASPETRQQGSLALAYAWNEAALEVGGGVSVERDYESRFVDLGLRLDFDRKLTTVELGLSHTNSTTDARIDYDARAYIDPVGYEDEIGELFTDVDGSQYIVVAQDPRLRATRRDWGLRASVSRIIDKASMARAGMSVVRSDGYLANPYKMVYGFYGFATAGQDAIAMDPGTSARLEVRPEQRTEFVWNLGYKRHVAVWDAAWEIDYSYHHDDWDIDAHTLETRWLQPLRGGWLLTPKLRYYSQSKAWFYLPYMVEIYDVNDVDYAAPLQVFPDTYSSDHRLSGYGALSGGLTLARRLARGVEVSAGAEYYLHRGGFKLGGGGEGDFADFDYWVAHATLNFAFDADVPLVAASHHAEASGHGAHAALPAGVMAGHALSRRGAWTVAYRYQRAEQSGTVRHGGRSVDAATVAARGCAPRRCAVAPGDMRMGMHMLDIMFAPTDRLTVMLMPSWVDMDMGLTALGLAGHGAHAHEHESGGLGDLGLHALVEVGAWGAHRLHLGFGVSAPVGATDLAQRNVAGRRADVPLHYNMQLGSGTWDFKPAVTWLGEHGRVLWGAQAGGTVRLEARNDAGFRFGNVLETTAWGGYRWRDWLSSTVRIAHVVQGEVEGRYPPLLNEYGEPFTPDHLGPFDETDNYGGRFLNLGLGAAATIPAGLLRGDVVKVEWVQPLATDFNGYQLDRDFSFNFVWSRGF